MIIVDIQNIDSDSVTIHEYLRDMPQRSCEDFEHGNIITIKVIGLDSKALLSVSVCPMIHQSSVHVTGRARRVVSIFAILTGSTKISRHIN